jgi:hypothetical protein
LQSQLLLRQRQKDLKFEASPGKSNSETVSKRKKKKRNKKAGDMTQVVKYLSCVHKALGFNSQYHKTQTNNNKSSNHT